MKKLLFVMSVLLLTCSAQSYAQRGGQRGDAPRSAEEIIAFQWERAASAAKLTKEQTEALADTYKAYRGELQELMPQMFRDEESKKKVEPTDEEVKANTLKQFSDERKRIDIQERYFNEFCKTLTPRQASLIINQRGGMPSSFGGPGGPRGGGQGGYGGPRGGSSIGGPRGGMNTGEMLRGNF